MLKTLAALLVFLSSVVAKPGYLLTTPNAVIPGSKHNICLALTDFTSDVQVYYEIRNNGSTQIYGGGMSTLPAEGGCYELQVSANIPLNEVELHVEQQPYSENMENYRFKGSTMLRVIRKVLQFTIIQTDKPVYMPNQTVRIRLVALRYNLKPIRDGVQNVSIQNPLGMDIERWENVAMSPGIVELNMKVAAEPIYGTYTISCSHRGTVEQLNFRVLKYVLPRIEIIQKHPEYFIRDTGDLTGEICSRYTFAGDRNLPSEKLLLEMNLFVAKVINTHVQVFTAPSFIVRTEMRGCYRYHVPSANLRDIWMRNDIEDLRLLVRANITEYGTGLKTNGRDAFIKLDTVNARPVIVGEDTYMPGLPYEFMVRLQHRNLSLAAHRNISARITSESQHLVDLAAQTNEAGIAFFSIKFKLQTLGFTVEASFRDEMHLLSSLPKTVTSWFSPTGRYLKLRVPNDGNALPCNRNVAVEFYYTTTSTGEIIRLNTQVIGLSKIVMSNSERKSLQPQESMQGRGDLFGEPSGICTNSSDARTPAREFRGTASTTFLVTPDMSPSSKLLIFYISADGEVVSDVMNIHVKECTFNPVRLSFSKSVVQPGKSTYLEISAAAGSLCTFGVTDRSVELLGNRDALNISQVFTKLQALFPLDYNWDAQLTKYRDYGSLCDSLAAGKTSSGFSYGNLADAAYAFLIGKTVVLTDLQVATRQSYCCSRQSKTANNRLHHPGDQEEDNVDEYKPSVNVRNYFPETWLWDAVIVNDSGSAIVPTIAPHTMTSWQGRAMCVHDSRGFGLSPVATLTTFQKFFMRVHLPYSAIRGESVPVVLKIHNYFSECFMIAVSIVNSEDFSTEREGTADMCVCGSRTVMHVFVITPRALGNVNVTVSATQVDTSKSNNTCPPSANMSRIIGVRDAVSKTVLVELEGRRQEVTKTFYACVSSGSPQNVTLPLNQAIESVPDSARGTVSVAGDVLAHTIGNLKTLVVLPYGCGEQKMNRFASTIFSLEYLEVTGQLSSDIQLQAISAIKEGYQQQLKHRCADGAFAFYERPNDKCPSNVWLTAFVVKCFEHAKRYVPFTGQDLQRSIAFITASQRPDGCFDQIGDGYYSRLAAAIRDWSPEKLRMRLTAFTAISLMEAGVPKQDIALMRAFSCLEGSQVTDIYGHALMTYALSLHEVGSQRHEKALKNLWDNATSTGRNVIGSSDYLVHWKGDSNSLSIEATSYAILALLKQPDIPRILPAVKWLTTQRNAYGGFISTQDTVVAVQALSEFAKASFARYSHTNLMVKVANQGWEKTFEVKGTNLNVQTVDISQLRSGNLTIQVEGEGCTVVQANIAYNVKSLTKGHGYFDTIVTPFSPPASESIDNCTLRQLHICTKFLGNEGNASNMAIIQIKMVSGWIPDKNSLDALIANDTLDIATYELDHGVLSLHFNKIPNFYECFSFYVKRTDMFKNVAPGYVATYEYYTHARRHDTNFTMEECSPTSTEVTCTSCDEDDEDDEDADPSLDPSVCPTCYEPQRLSDLCQHRHVLKAKLRLTSINDKAILISADLKGRNTQLHNLTATPFVDASCDCAPLDSQDATKSFFIAYTRQVARRRTNIGLYLSDTNILIFENRRELEPRIIRQLQQCYNAK